MTEPQRKRRKWDVADPAGAASTAIPAVGNAGTTPGTTFLKPQLDAEAIKRAQQAAAAVANKLNMEVIAKGMVPASKLGLIETRGEVAKEVFINDAPTAVRHHLTKKTTQDDISRRTHTVIVTRGRYYPAGAVVSDSEKPLHLRITPSVDAGPTHEHKQQAVSNAAAEVQRILQGERRPSGSDTTMGAAGAVPPAYAPNATCVYVGFDAPPHFALADRIRGTGGSFLSHISNQTGATVVLKGRGSGNFEGPEPLHVLITAPTPQSLQDAQRLASDLVQTVRSEFYKMYPHAAAPMPVPPPAMPGVPPPSAGYYPPYSHAAPPPATAAVPPYAAPPAMPGVPPIPHAGHMPHMAPPPAAPYAYPPYPASGWAPPAAAPAAAPHAMPLPAAAPTPQAAVPPAYMPYAAPQAPAVPYTTPTGSTPHGGAPHSSAPHSSAPPATAAPYSWPTQIPTAPPPVSGIIGTSTALSTPPVPGILGPAQVSGQGGTAAASQQAQPGSPPKRKFREFKEEAPRSQAASTAAAPSQTSGSVYAQHFPTPGSLGAVAIQQPLGGAPTGSVKVNAGIMGGLVDYEADD